MSGERLRVATDTLRDLSSEVETISSKLDATDSLLESHRDDVGDDGIAGALGDFEDHWERGRRKIREKSEAIGSMLVDSADAYEQTDSETAGGLSRDDRRTTVGGR
ncbi:MAG: type VII secretion target [Leucobacter sp.]